MQNKLCVCVHEDRTNCQIGLQLTCVSIARAHPNIPLWISAPGISHSQLSWVASIPNAHYCNEKRISDSGWNIKPALILDLLEREFEEVVWVDSDIVVTAPFLHDVTSQPSETLVATEEPFWGQLQGGAERTLAWGLTPQRIPKTTINTGLVRATRHHIPLLKTWLTYLRKDEYIETQKKPWHKRPIHMIGDQEVLTALMGSTEFANIPLFLLRRGIDIAQCFGPAGFTPWERIARIGKGLPPLVHAMGAKPWTRPTKTPPITSLREYYDYIALELSPYITSAKEVLAFIQSTKIGTSGNTDSNIADAWTKRNSFATRIFTSLSFQDGITDGLFLSIIDSIGRIMKRILRIGRYKVHV